MAVALKTAAARLAPVAERLVPGGCKAMAVRALATTVISEGVGAVHPPMVRRALADGDRVIVLGAKTAADGELRHVDWRASKDLKADIAKSQVLTAGVSKTHVGDAHRKRACFASRRSRVVLTDPRDTPWPERSVSRLVRS